MHKLCFILIILSISGSTLLGQQLFSVDSAKARLGKSEYGMDKLYFYSLIIEYYLKKNVDSASHYANASMKLAKIIGDSTQLAKSVLAYGMVKSVQEKSTNA